MNAKERLQNLQATLEQRGVQDVKFFFAMTPETPVSAVAADVISALEAVVGDKCTEMALTDID